MFISGTIPAKVNYVYNDCSRPVKIGINDFHIPADTINAHPLFVVDAKNKNTLKTAIRSADSEKRYYHDGKTVTQICDTVIEERDNSPISNLKVVGNNHYRNNVKVLIEDKFYADLSYDTFVEASMNSGIKDGLLQGEFVWARKHSQILLVRVGSDTHSLLNELCLLKSLPLLKSKQLQVGGIYKNKSGDESVYLGKVNSVKFNYSLDPAYTCSHNVSNAMLFYRKNTYNHKSKTIEEQLQNYKEQTYGLSLLGKADSVKQYGQIDLKEDYVQLFKDHYIASARQLLVQHSLGKMTKRSLYDVMSYNSVFLNMVSESEEVETTFDLNKFLLFV